MIDFLEVVIKEHHFEQWPPSSKANAFIIRNKGSVLDHDMLLKDCDDVTFKEPIIIIIDQEDQSKQLIASCDCMTTPQFCVAGFFIVMMVFP